MMPVLAQAQTASWEWAASGTDAQEGQGVSIVSDNSGNTYITGAFTNTFSIGSHSVNSAGNRDIFIAKFDTNGQVMWLNSVGGSGEDRGYGVAIDEAENVFVLGTFSGTVIFDDNTVTSAVGLDAVLIKYNNSGNFVWSKTWGGSVSDAALNIAISSGDIYMTGYFMDTVNFGTTSLTCLGIVNIFILKLDTMGNVVWARKAGGNNGDFPGSLSIGTQGRFYITGSSGSTMIDFGGVSVLNADMFVACYDTSGTPLWARNAYADNGLYGSGVANDSSGNVYVVGHWFDDQDVHFGSTTLSNYHSYLAKYNSSGTLQWVKGIVANSDEAAYALVLDSDRNIYVSGSFNGWGTFGTQTVFTQGGQDVFVEKLDSNGDYIWSSYGGGNGGDGAYSMVLDNNGSVVLTGYMSSSNAVFGSSTLSTGGGQDMFVAKLSQTTGLPTTAGKDKQLYIYPNPANDMLYIRGIKENTEYKIVSITGAALQEGVITKNRNAIDIQSLSPGIYLLYAAGEVHKIIKE